MQELGNKVVLEECYSLIKDAIHNYNNVEIVSVKVFQIKEYKNKLPKDMYIKIEQFIGDVIDPLIYDIDYFSFLKKEQYGSYNENGHFIVNSDSSLEMILFNKYFHIQELLEKLNEFFKEEFNLDLCRKEIMDNKKFDEQRYNRKKQKYRFLLGFQQLINYPFINCIWIIFIVGIKNLFLIQREIFFSFRVHSRILLLYKGCVHFIEFFVLVICIIGIIQVIGYVTAKKDEAVVSKVFGKNKDVKHEPPILIKKRKRKGVTTREFYTTISMREWKNKAEEICDDLDIHLIRDITYGGKNENTGYLRKMISGKGRNPQNRGVLYDETF